MIILGAGLTGLIAACNFQNAIVYEKNSDSALNHKALLRFRSPAVGENLGIEFKKVNVKKAIYHNGSFVQPNISLCNMYSDKVSGNVSDRSIWNIKTVDRWIAPENLHEQLAERCKGRIKYNVEVDYLPKKDEKIISTIPMNIIAGITGIKNSFKFEYKKIIVERYKIEKCDVYQTIYFPSTDRRIYRASITGDILIIESTYFGDNLQPTMSEEISKIFNVTIKEKLNVVSQNFGKISPIPDIERKEFIRLLTVNHNILSLGRFAIWKNILLDDVIQDINVLKKLIHMGDYDIMKKNLENL